MVKTSVLLEPLSAFKIGANAVNSISTAVSCQVFQNPASALKAPKNSLSRCLQLTALCKNRVWPFLY